MTNPKSSDDLFAYLDAAKAKQPNALKPKSNDKGQASLLPDRHPQQDFFVLDMVDYALKDDGASMEAPIFSLSKNKDTKTWRWSSADGKKSLTVTCSAEYGRATQFDKDVLIFCISQLRAAMNEGLEVSRTVRFTVYDYLVATNRHTSGSDYQRLKQALNRLAGTRLETNIETGGAIFDENFGLIENFRAVKPVGRPVQDGKMGAIEIRLSEWLYNAVRAKEVLTIDRGYFRLGKPLERRLYEIARKHVGKQGAWAISLEQLKEKCGSTTRRIRDFKADVLAIAEADTLPQYRLAVEGDLVVFTSKDAKQQIAAISKAMKK